MIGITGRHGRIHRTTCAGFTGRHALDSVDDMPWIRWTTSAGIRIQAVGDRQIEYDLRFLWAILNWATKTGDHDGTVLLAQNPLRQFVTSRDWPREKNPERPSLSEAQIKALLEAACEMDWRFAVALVLAHETGHRIGSIRTLRWSDVDPERGWIRWREETDKVDWEHHTPLTGEALQALEAAGAHRLNGKDGWVLPSPSDPNRPCSRNIMRDWWDLAQENAGLRHDQRQLDCPLTTIRTAGSRAIRNVEGTL